MFLCFTTTFSLLYSPFIPPPVPTPTCSSYRLPLPKLPPKYNLQCYLLCSSSESLPTFCISSPQQPSCPRVPLGLCSSVSAKGRYSLAASEGYAMCFCVWVWLCLGICLEIWVKAERLEPVQAVITHSSDLAQLDNQTNVTVRRGKNISNFNFWYIWKN